MTAAPKHLVQFSTGLSSAEVAWRLTDQYGPDAVVLMTADTLKEHPDNWRFAREVVARLGCEWIKLTDGRDPMQVGRDAKCVPNNKMAVCSKVLKRELLRWYLDANYDPAADIVYIGYDWSEPSRITSAGKFWAPWKMDALLARPPYAPPLEDLFRSRGIEPPELYKYGLAHSNCFAPETRFITAEGAKTLAECLGKSVRVLGSNAGWHDAEIHSFGEQELLRVTLQRYGDSKVVDATADHLWPVRTVAGRARYTWRATADLKAGERIAGMYGKVRHNVTPSAVGVAAGFTFGDGTADRPANGQITPARAFLCGDKDKALLPYFSSCRASTREDGVVVIHDLPRAWKQTPPLDESQSFLYGWLAGYFAADGTFAKGSARLSSASRPHLEFVRDLCMRIGIACQEIRVEQRKGFGEIETPLYTLALVVFTLRSDFFVIPEHRRRFESRTDADRRPADWQVVSVERTGRRDEVMCAVVPDGNMFTLDGNLLTHNCGGFCVRSGQAQWALMLKVDRCGYLEWEREEEETRALLGKNVAILRDRRKAVVARYGKAQPISLQEFRESIDRQLDIVDGEDWGACGCDMDGDAAPAEGHVRAPKVERWNGTDWVGLTGVAA